MLIKRDRESSFTSLEESSFLLVLALAFILLLISTSAFSQVLSGQKLVGNWHSPSAPLANVHISIWEDERPPSEISRPFQMQGLVYYPDAPQCAAAIVVFPLSHMNWRTWPIKTLCTGKPSWLCSNTGVKKPIK